MIRKHKSEDPMAEPIAICGNRCDVCPAYYSNVKALDREQVAGGWLRYHGFGVFFPEQGCRGCPPDQGGPPHPDCPVRRCVVGRGLSTCSDCQEASCDPPLASLTIFERARQA